MAHADVPPKFDKINITHTNSISKIPTAKLRHVQFFVKLTVFFVTRGMLLFSSAKIDENKRRS